MNRTEKQELVDDLKKRVEKARFAVVTDFRGLSVADMGKLRKGLREADMEYQVVKNTLLRRATEGTDVAKLSEHFVGPTAIGLCYGDPVESAKVLSKFEEDSPHFTVKAGVLVGKPVDAAAIKAIAKLPSREVLLGQVLSAMNGVPTGFVRALADVPRRMLNVLNAIRDQKEAA